MRLATRPRGLRNLGKGKGNSERTSFAACWGRRACHMGKPAPRRGTEARGRNSDHSGLKKRFFSISLKQRSPIMRYSLVEHEHCLILTILTTLGKVGCLHWFGLLMTKTAINWWLKQGTFISHSSQPGSPRARSQQIQCLPGCRQLAFWCVLTWVRVVAGTRQRESGG